MSVFLTLLKRELRSFFYSPVAYVVLALVMVINGFSFRAAVAVLETGPQPGSIVTITFSSYWFWLSYFFIFPLLTMRLFAEENREGTIELLMTLPVRDSTLVIGKYLGAWAYYDVFVYVPDFCAKVTACIPVEVLITTPLLAIAPAMVLVEIARIVLRRRRERRVPPDGPPDS